MAFLNNKKIIVIFFLVLSAGIFFRTYNFSDWLKFNSDQARDASVVHDMVEKGERPVLGPVAGGTLFRLGPATYYFSFLSAKLFGNSPEKMAYPDLFWGVLAIVLLYFMLRQFFAVSIALSLTGLYAVSNYAIIYARFAWNPNSSQFFCLLLIYCVIKILNGEKKFIWVLLAGISLGVGIQLHTVLLFALPVFFTLVAFYMIRKKTLGMAKILLIVAIAVLTNIPQIISEIKTNGDNYTQFRQGLIGKSEKQAPMIKNGLHILSCQVQSGLGVLIPGADPESCEDPFADKYFKRLSRNLETSRDWIIYFVKFIAVASFSIGGFFLFGRRLQKETDVAKKNFLLVIIMYIGSIFVVSVPFGAEISLRYFIFSAFFPFVLLGLWMELAFRRFKDPLVAYLCLGLLITYNLFFNISVFRAYANNIPGGMVDGTMLQAKIMASHLIKESGGGLIQLSAKKTDLGRFANRIDYFASESEARVFQLDGYNKLDKNRPVFYAVDKMSEPCVIGEMHKLGKIADCANFFQVTILKIDPKEIDRIGWINDIHAGTEMPDKTRESPPYPREYKIYLEKVFRELGAQGIDTLITGGDNTYHSHMKTVSDMTQLVKAYGIDMIWTRGNHDELATMNIFGLKKLYYSRDYPGLKIIILDNSDGDYYGSIDAPQMKWLKKELETKKNVIIVMHIPIFKRPEDESKLLKCYVELEKMLSESGNVKLVLSGHYHDDSDITLNGVRYLRIRPLTQKDYKGTYAIINTDDFSVEHKITE